MKTAFRSGFAVVASYSVMLPAAIVVGELFRIWRCLRGQITVAAVLLLLAGGAWAATVQCQIPATSVLVNSTVTANGSLVVAGLPASEIDLLWNVTGSVTGTLPTLTFTVTPVDPLNTGTPLAGDIGAISTATISSATSGTITGIPLRSSAVKVSWIVGGTSPSFGGVYASLVVKNPSSY